MVVNYTSIRIVL